MRKQVKRVHEGSPPALTKEDGNTGAPPSREISGGPQGDPMDEEGDGLDDVARALRDAAIGPIGRRELGK